MSSTRQEDDAVLRQYILITSAKDEEDNLQRCILSVRNQTVIPVLWVIIDDGSVDETHEIIEENINRYKWIKTLTLDVGVRDLGIHYSSICKNGFDLAAEYCKEHGIRYNYIGHLDADIFLRETYFEKLIKEFEKDNALGIASGETWYIHGNTPRHSKQPEDLASGAARLLRKKCFDEIGGYTITYALDSITNIKAKLRGWKVKRFKEYRFIQSRMTASAEGLWVGWGKLGETACYLGEHPLFVIMKAIRQSFEKPCYIGLAFFIGYMKCYIQRKKHTEDEEIRQYYRYTRPQEHIKSYWNKIKNVFR